MGSDTLIVKRIQEIIEEYADNRDEMDSLKVANEIYELSNGKYEPSYQHLKNILG